MMSPLTVLLTEEQMKLKQKQIKEKAPPPGAAKILTRARKEQKKQQQQQPTPAITTPHPPNQTPTSNLAVTSPVKAANENVAVKNSGIKESQKSKTRTDESSTIFASNRDKESSNLKQNNLDTDEEWQNLLEDNAGSYLFFLILKVCF
jgi:hypothetical protein